MSVNSQMSYDEQRRIFVQEYCGNGRDAEKAAIAAGFEAARGKRLLDEPLIDMAIKCMDKARAQEMEFNHKRWLLEVSRIAYFDPGRMFSSDGHLREVHQMDDDTRAVIAEIEVKRVHIDTIEEPKAKRKKDSPVTETARRTTTVTKVKSWSKISALEMLGKANELFTDRTKLLGADGQTLKPELHVHFVKAPEYGETKSVVENATEGVTK